MANPMRMAVSRIKNRFIRKNLTGATDNITFTLDEVRCRNPACDFDSLRKIEYCDLDSDGHSSSYLTVFTAHAHCPLVYFWTPCPFDIAGLYFILE